MNKRALLVAGVGLLVFTSGCFTYRDKVAYKRAELVLTDRGQSGDALALACSKEIHEANIDTGADKVALAPADLTPEAAQANTGAIIEDRAARQVLVDTGRGLLGGAGPWGAGILAALTLAGGIYTQLRKYKAAAETMAEGIGQTAHQETKDAVKSLAIDAGIQPFVDSIVQRIDPPKGA
jgi:hypothetical protein